MEKQIKIALAGNPNSGKTTLFNALTGSNQFVGNWPGVTVEKKEGKLKKHDDVVIMDLPGIYSLSPYTLEEVVSRNYLITERPDAILNIVDGTNLERNLYLTTQLTELGIPVVVAINMMDVVKKNGDQINIKELSRQLGCPVLEISALKGDGVMAAAEAAETKHGVVVQDTAWEGYEEIPAWIMQGYGTMASESADQLRQMGINRPTHVFVQAGVGSLAGAVIGYYTNLFPNDPPKFVVMEARAADCLYRGALAGDGAPRIVEGDLQTIMAGLACGEPNTISWDILRNHVSAFVSCPDWVSARGMRMLGVPVKGDPVVISGESGAVGMGLIAALMETDEYQDLREAIGLDRFSQVLLFSTEGNTDPMKFRKVLWDGEYPTV